MVSFNNGQNGKYNAEAKIERIIFGEGAPLLESELNEMQRLEVERNRDLVKAIYGSNINTSILEQDVTVDNELKTITLSGIYMFYGNILNCSPVTLNLEELGTGTVFLNVVSSYKNSNSNYYKSGYNGVGNIPIDYTAVDPRVGSETSRRLVSEYRYTVGSKYANYGYMTIGRISKDDLTGEYAFKPPAITRSIQKTNLTDDSGDAKVITYDDYPDLSHLRTTGYYAIGRTDAQRYIDEGQLPSEIFTFKTSAHVYLHVYGKGLNYIQELTYTYTTIYGVTNRKYIRKNAGSTSSMWTSISDTNFHSNAPPTMSGFQPGITNNVISANVSEDGSTEPTAYEEWRDLVYSTVGWDKHSIPNPYSIRVVTECYSITSPTTSLNQTINVYSNALGETLSKLIVCIKRRGANRHDGEPIEWRISDVTFGHQVGQGTPEGVLSGVRGMTYTDVNTLDKYFKRSGFGNNTGWVKIGGIIA